MKDDTRKLSVIHAWIARDPDDDDIYIYFIEEPELDPVAEMYIVPSGDSTLAIIRDIQTIPMMSLKEVKVYVDSDRKDNILGSFRLCRRMNKEFNNYEYYIPYDDVDYVVSEDIIDHIERYFKFDADWVRCIVI